MPTANGSLPLELLLPGPIAAPPATAAGTGAPAVASTPSPTCSSATERASPKPLAAGICARRQATLFLSTDPYPRSRRRGPRLRRARSRRSPRPATAAGSRARPGGRARRAPMWKSAPSGPATSSAKNVPRLRPVIRRTTSPTRNPWVRWCPAGGAPLPLRSLRGRRAVAAGQSQRSWPSRARPSRAGPRCARAGAAPAPRPCLPRRTPANTGRPARPGRARRGRPG